ncbi:MAG: hypothetical protein ACXWLH_00740, partial [Candidatus Saccharimonadales bacterium]
KTKYDFAQMSDIVVPLPPERAVYLGESGHPVDFDEYLDFEKKEAARCLNSLSARRGTHVMSPASIMTLIAMTGEPTLTDFDIRFRTPYALMPDEALDQTLKVMTRHNFLTIKDDDPIVLPERARIPGRPGIIIRKLVELEFAAYEEIPNLTKILDIRTGNAKPERKRVKNRSIEPEDENISA